eukprot:1035448-Pyramimonas_sp.AAC.1
MVKTWVACIIRWALSLRGPNYFVDFVTILCILLQNRLEYIWDPDGVGPGPDAARYRDGCCDLFLGASGGSTRCQRVRRYVIMGMANGDTMRKQMFQHYCRPGCCRDRSRCTEKLVGRF